MTGVRLSYSLSRQCKRQAFYAFGAAPVSLASFAGRQSWRSWAPGPWLGLAEHIPSSPYSTVTGTGTERYVFVTCRIPTVRREIHLWKGTELQTYRLGFGSALSSFLSIGVAGWILPCPSKMTLLQIRKVRSSAMLRGGTQPGCFFRCHEARAVQSKLNPVRSRKSAETGSCEPRAFPKFLSPACSA